MSTLRAIIEAIRSEPPANRLRPEHAAIRGHLLSDKDLLDRLTTLLSTRIEDRGTLPPPSNPHDAAILLGRDAECREIARLLTLLASLPVSPLADEEDIARPDHNRALGPRIRPS